MSEPMPPSTPHSLLGRMLQSGPNNEDAWREFVTCYGPLVAAWCSGGGFQENEAKDVIQEVLLRLFRYLRNYKRSEEDSAIGCAVVRNVMIDYRAKEGRDRMATLSLDAAAEPSAPVSLEERLEKQFQREILIEARGRVRSRCAERDWIIFCRLVDDACSSEEAARQYGLRIEMIYKIKSTVLKQVRQEVGRLEEEGFDGA